MTDEEKQIIERMRELINRYYNVCAQIPKELRTMTFDSCLEDTRLLVGEQTALRHSNDVLHSLSANLDYAKTIIQDLLNNSDEYARQRALDFLREE